MAKKPTSKKGNANNKPAGKKSGQKKPVNSQPEAVKKPVETKKPTEKVVEKSEKNTEKKTDGKKPWSTKKKVIFWSCLGGGVVLAAVIAVVLVVIFTRVDYKEAYDIADQLKSEIYDLKSSDCSNVTSYVSSSYTSEKEYSKYIEKCKNTGTEVEALVERLENSSAVQRDEKIKREFDKFKKEYDEVLGNSEKKEQALKLYETWHKWILASSDLSDYDESDADLEAAAKVLTESGNDELKEYGETWLKYKKELASTYRAYRDVSYSADNYDDIYNAYSKARSAYSNWYYKNAIKIADVADWKASSYSDLYGQFNDLYESIEKSYQGEGGGEGNSKIEEMIKNSNGSSSQSSGSGSYEDILKMLGK